MNIDITTTATIRPKLFERTLDSFYNNMFSKFESASYRLVLNIDPIGENIDPMEMVDVAKKYFNNISYNISETPSFCKAYNWCWSSTESKYFFNLEDDWILLKPICLQSMIEIMEPFESMVSLRLSKDPMKKKYVDEGGFCFYDKISLNPSLFRGHFFRLISKHMDLSLNPEKQLRVSSGGKRGRLISEIKAAVYLKEGREAIVKDTGREWMKRSKFHKQIGFTQWETSL